MSKRVCVFLCVCLSVCVCVCARARVYLSLSLSLCVCVCVCLDFFENGCGGAVCQGGWYGVDVSAWIAVFGG